MRILLIIFLVIPLLASGQRKGRDKGPTISFYSSINVNSKPFKYSWLTIASETKREDLDLTFETPNSGTFIVEDGDLIRRELQRKAELPYQILGIGAGVRIEKNNRSYYDISFTKLNISKSDIITEQEVYRNGEFAYKTGTGQLFKSGMIGFRFELGKMFTKLNSKSRFGLGIGLEPIVFFMNSSPYESYRYPIRGSVLFINLSFLPQATFSLGDRTHLDIKLVGNIIRERLISNLNEINPNIDIRSQSGMLADDSPRFTLGGSIQFRYDLKQPGRSRRGR